MEPPIVTPTDTNTTTTTTTITTCPAEQINVMDVFDDLREENLRLSNELAFANKCLDILSKFKTFLYNQYIDVDKISAEESSGISDDAKNIDSSSGGDTAITHLKELENEWNNAMIEKKVLVIENYERICEPICELKTIDDNSVDIKDESMDDEDDDDDDDDDDEEDEDFECNYSDGDNDKEITLDTISEEMAAVSRDVESFTRTLELELFNILPHLRNKDMDIEFVNVPSNNQKRSANRSRINNNNRQTHVSSNNNTNDVIGRDSNTGTSIRYEYCYFPDCDFKAIRMVDITQHVRDVHTNNNSMLCPICGKSQTHLRKHVTRVHNKLRGNANNQYKCTKPDCDVAVKTPEGLNSHLKAHAVAKRYVCDWANCQFKTMVYGRYLTHRRIHTGDRPFMCLWPGCDKTFSAQSGLYHHQTFTHSEVKRFKCDFEGCSAEYKTKQPLILHKRQHLGVRPFPCDWPGCEFRAVSIARLNYHRHSHGERRFKCLWPGCTSTFANKSRFDQHMNKHKGVTPFHCTFPECGRSFVSSEYLKTHQLRHNTTYPYKCEFQSCEKRFIFKSIMRKHMRVHGISQQQMSQTHQ